jgi:hypothetical protein
LNPPLGPSFLDFGLLSHALLSPKGESISFILCHIPHIIAPSTRLRNHLNFNAKLANMISLKNQPFFFYVVVDPKWVCASEKEITYIDQNQLWSLMNLPIGKQAIHSKWVYIVKINLSNSRQGS